MLTIHQSNQLEQLAAQFTALVKKPCGDVFDAEQVVVQNAGMARWLQLKVANQNGISANLQSLFPAEFMWSLLYALIPGLPEQDPCAPSVLRWRILRLLLEDPADFPELMGYLNGSGGERSSQGSFHDVQDVRDRERKGASRNGIAVENRQATDSELRAWELAGVIAKLLDQYLFYRDELIRQWQAGLQQDKPSIKDGTDSAAVWQSALWQKIIVEPGLIHWLELQDLLSERLTGGSVDTFINEGLLPRRVSFFSLAALSPGYLRLLGVLGELIDIHLFVVNPCREYWGDIESEKSQARQAGIHQDKIDSALDRVDSVCYHASYVETGHPLLASMGRQGRDFIDQLLELPGSVTEEKWCCPATYQSNDGDCNDPDHGCITSTLLQQIQTDILFLQQFGGERTADFAAADVVENANSEGAFPADGSFPAEGSFPADGSFPAEGSFPADGSITILSCHSPLREVEVLQDQLLDLIESTADQHSGIQPSDIVVMMPDVERYAPLIESVFSNALHSLPYSIADRVISRSHQEIEAFIKFLDLIGSHFEAESVMELLDYAFIRERFGLSETDVWQCRNWVGSTNIRWGIDRENRLRQKMPPTAEHTWRYALDRLLLGYALNGQELVEDSGPHAMPLLPYTDLEGSQALLLANFIRFCDVLFDFDAKIRDHNTRRVSEWSTLMRDMLHALYNEQSQLDALYSTLDSLLSQAQLAGFDKLYASGPDSGTEPRNAETATTVSFELIRTMTRQSLQDVSGPESYLGHGITFCALVPMRSVPFKVVVLLGMNDGDYPRQDNPLSFDLMKNKPRRGDRSRRNEDRYLFLESLLAAREKLIISYVGQSISDNTRLPPSVLVSELLDEMSRMTGLDHADLVTPHPLQPFSRRYFGTESVAPHSQPHDKKKRNGNSDIGDMKDGSSPRVALFSYAEQYALLLQNRHKTASTERLRQAFMRNALPQLDASERKVQLSDLIRFYQSPAREFLRRRFGLSHYDEALQLTEREPFTLEPFIDNRLRRMIIDASIAERTGADTLEKSDNSDVCETEDNHLSYTIRNKARALGLLPHGTIGDLLFDREYGLAKTFSDGLPIYATSFTRSFDLSIEPFQLLGQLDQLVCADPYASCRTLCRHIVLPHEPYFRDWIAIWLSHLALGASLLADSGSGLAGGFEGRESLSYKTQVFTPENSFVLQPLAAEEATGLLDRLLEFYWDGLHFPLHFFPKSAFSMFKTPYQADSADLTRAYKQWINDHNRVAESERFENRLLFGHVEDQRVLFDQQFQDVSELVWHALFRCLEVAK